MDIRYISTRGDKEEFTASQAVIKGLSNDGGLFVPKTFPKAELDLGKLIKMDYKETALFVLGLFFTDYTEEELKYCVEKAYDAKFDDPEIAPLAEHDGRFFLELFHGPTIAFKDMALSILPHLLTCALKKNGIKEEVVIMTATSGDTGKAALAAFADVPGTKIIVFYPKGGVSTIQELMMVTQKGANTKVIGVEGNFDDCQSSVKKMFGDKALGEEIAKCGFRFSSANSINIGRLIPQVAYYLYAYSLMVKKGAIKAGDKLNFTVPTGNFGNILAAFYAKKLGLPIGKLICASNINKVLYDFFETGIYDRRRQFVLTSSPSMDILISSNLERLLYDCVDCDSDEIKHLMDSLSNEGIYRVSDKCRANMKDFTGIFATEEQVNETIRKIYEDCGYVIDTHTAVAAYADMKYAKSSDEKSVIISTASPFKFCKSVLEALGAATDRDDFSLADSLSSLSHVKIPSALSDLKSAEILHKDVCPAEDMSKLVKEFLKV